MALMIPPVISPETQSRAEKDLFNKLEKQLGKSYTVFHSFKLLNKRNDKPGHKTIETDFLVYHPSQGFVIIEVKGGSIRYDGTTDEWWTNREKMSSPYEQVKRHFHEISRYFGEELGIDYKSLPFVFGYSIAFPDVTDKPQKMPAESLPEITLTQGECNYLQESIESLFAHYAINEEDQNKDILQRAVKAMTREFEFLSKHKAQIPLIKETIHSLTEEQCILMDFLGNRREALIEGCAGSGKTIMALKKARQLAEEDNKVLLLCYNDMLGSRLINSIQSSKSEKARANITCKTFHAWCVKVLKENNAAIPVRPADSKYWNEDLPQAALKCLENNGEKYDAIIIDEAQDLKVEFWLVINEVRKPDGYFFIFYDLRQNLYARNVKKNLPLESEPYSLTRNCRNTRSIGTLVKKLSSQRMEPHHAAPEGVPLDTYTCRSNTEVVKAIEKILNELTIKHLLTTDQIVILGAHTLKNTSLAGSVKAGKYRISENGRESGPDTVPYYTYMKFKGCESDAVIIVDVDPNDERWQSRRGLYTSLSRAVSVASVIYRVRESNSLNN